MLQRVGIDMKYCLSDSTDAAHGENSGLQKKISDEAEHHEYTWCYAHGINSAVVTMTTCSRINDVSFCHLQKAAIFIKVSSKRVTGWIQMGGKRHR